MARVLEHDSKQLLQRLNIPVPKGKVAASPSEAELMALEIGFPVVIKALVPVGKRGKAGVISFAANAAEVIAETQRILGMTVSYYPVEKVLIESKLAIKQELYLSVSIDKNRRLPVVIASSMGGTDVEELSEKHPGQVVKIYVDPFVGLHRYKAVEIWSELGIRGKLLRQLAEITFNLYRGFTQYDATIWEINPLVITAEEEVIAASSVLSIDESAIYRQCDLQDMVTRGSDRTWRPLTELEKHMVAVNEAEPYRGTARYTELESGDIGFMCGGGGASLLLMDALIKAGGRPANYSEVGGNPTEEKVYGLCKGILSKSGVKGFLLAHNITSNTQIDVVARGVVRAFRELGLDPSSFPVVVREAGTHDEAGKKILEDFGIEYHGEDITLTEAARLIVAKMSGRTENHQGGDN